MSDQNSKVIDPEAPELHLPSRSMLNAYVLLLPGVFFGIHRFYVGKWRTGLLYLPGLFFLLFLIADLLPEDVVFEVFKLIFLAVLLADGWFLRRWVAEFNQKFVTEYEMYPERYQIEDAEHIAPWARGRAKKVKLGLIARINKLSRNYVFFLILPFANGLAASHFESVELLMIPIVILIIIGLIGSLDKTLVRYPTIQEIPGVGQALGRVDAMRKLYWEKEPNVLGAFKGLFMKAGKEYKPYWGIASIVFASVIISGLMSHEVNLAFIDPYVAVKIIGFTAMFAAAVILVNLVPVTALSFHYSLSGKTTRLGFMTLLAIFATFSGFIGEKKLVTVIEFVFGDEFSTEETTDGSGAIPKYLSRKRIDERMKHADFQKELKKRMAFFLGYYMEPKTTEIEIDQKPVEIELREVFSDLMSKLAPNDESTAFGVFVEDEWLAIVYHHDNGQCYIPMKKVAGKTSRRMLIKGKAEAKLQEKNANLKDEESEFLLGDLFIGPFSILAVAPLLNDEKKKTYILDLIKKHDGAPLKLAKAMAKKKIHYEWTDKMIPDQANYIPQACFF